MQDLGPPVSMKQGLPQTSKSILKGLRGAVENTDSQPESLILEAVLTV